MKNLLTIACLFIFALIFSAPDSGAAQPEIDPQKLAARIHELVDQERTKHNLPPLAWNEALAEIALKHSEDMRENEYLSHTNRSGETPSERGVKAGFICRKKYDSYYEVGLAENLLQNSLFHATRYTISKTGETRERLWNTLEELASSTVQGWMTSEEHRENILNPRHDTEGIGVAIAEDGKVYITQLFC